MGALGTIWGLLFGVRGEHTMEANQVQPRRGASAASRCMNSGGDIWLAPVAVGNLELQHKLARACSL